MTIRNICLLSILGMLLIFTFTGKSSDAQSHKFRIHVSVSTDDENTKSLMQSWIKRELRSLGDVNIVSFDDASYILGVVAVEPTYTSGRKTNGIAIGSNFLMKARDTGLYYYPSLTVHTADIRDLESLCKGIVADIDTHRLESIRELFQ